jgi:hypothetical protein
MAAPLLTEALPQFASELERSLRRDGERALADQIGALRLVDRCHCEDDFCGMFYTAPKPSGPWRDLGQHENVEVNAESGMVVLDLVDGHIMAVEVLYRDDVRDALHAVLA